MDFFNYFMYLLCTILLISSVFFLNIGGKALLQSKPVIYKAKWLFYLQCLILVPGILYWGYLFTSQLIYPTLYSYGIDWLQFVQMLFWSAQLIIFWFCFKGFIIVGVDDQNMEALLSHALHKNDIVHEKNLSKIKLIDLDTDLNVAVTSWMGVGQVKIKNGKYNQVLRALTKDMQYYIDSKEMAVQKISARIYLMTGVLKLALIIAILHMIYQMSTLFNSPFL